MKRLLAKYAVPVARHLPVFLRAPLQRAWHSYALTARNPRLSAAEYAERVSKETEIFDEQEIVHDLPEIYHYWSNKYLRPKLEEFGISNPDEFFAKFLIRSIEEHPGRSVRFVSLGCGNCDTEVRIAGILRDRGFTDFTLECVDINATMLERGAVHAANAGLSKHVVMTRGDFNRWRPDARYDAIIANQSLHHVVELEDLFTSISRALNDDGRFITSDMIGRNGHMLWPEALSILREYWQELPKEKTFNVLLRRYEAEFGNWDCSGSGFEGIRAQDILPLLIERFDFEFFVGFANIIDPFIGRCHGPHLDAASEKDRTFVDRIHARDEAEMLAGNIKPTHMMAVMRKPPFADLACWKHMTPAFCVRKPD
ncbi:MAG: class I SAM-dependent methyltransferase [Rudaea sp.]